MNTVFLDLINIGSSVVFIFHFFALLTLNRAVTCSTQDSAYGLQNTAFKKVKSAFNQADAHLSLLSYCS